MFGTFVEMSLDKPLFAFFYATFFFLKSTRREVRAWIRRHCLGRDKLVEKSQHFQTFVISKSVFLSEMIRKLQSVFRAGKTSFVMRAQNERPVISSEYFVLR